MTLDSTPPHQVLSALAEPRAEARGLVREEAPAAGTSGFEADLYLERLHGEALLTPTPTAL